MNSKKLLATMVLALALAGCSKDQTLQLVPGPQGPTGPTGAQGPQGDPGETGPQGPQGTQGEQGIPGLPGSNGTNGHSLVSQVTQATWCECPYGGTSLDIYVDMDDSLNYSDADLYQGSLIACNGANGLKGPQGLQGAQGIQGVPGAQGPQGQQGPQGIQGLAGPAGANGSQGAPGPTGPAGPTGPQGATGAQGPAGSGAVVVQYTVSSCTSMGGGYYFKGDNGSIDVYTSSSCNGNHDQLNDNSTTMWLTSSTLAIYVSGSTVRVLTFN